VNKYIITSTFISTEQNKYIKNSLSHTTCSKCWSVQYPHFSIMLLKFFTCTICPSGKNISIHHMFSCTWCNE